MLTLNNRTVIVAFPYILNQNSISVCLSVYRVLLATLAQLDQELQRARK